MPPQAVPRAYRLRDLDRSRANAFGKGRATGTPLEHPTAAEPPLPEAEPPLEPPTAAETPLPKANPPLETLLEPPTAAETPLPKAKPPRAPRS